MGGLRRPHLFRLAGKDGEEKGRLGRGWCNLHLNLGEKQICQHAYRTDPPYRILTTRRPSFRYRIWQPLQVNRCRKSVLLTKFVMQYGFALVCQATRERFKKTEGAGTEDQRRCLQRLVPLCLLLTQKRERKDEKRSFGRIKKKMLRNFGSLGLGHPSVNFTVFSADIPYPPIARRIPQSDDHNSP